VRVAALQIALLATVLTGCGSKPATQNKRLAEQGPCDLVKIEDLEKMFGPVDTDPGPHQEGQQCFYMFEKVAPAISRAAEGARPGASFEIDGVAAKRFEKNGACAIDVWLVPGDINQQFGVVNIGRLDDKGPCELSIDVARLILNNLPG
jgi:hypothetical protein